MKYSIVLLTISLVSGFFLESLRSLVGSKTNKLRTNRYDSGRSKHYRRPKHGRQGKRYSRGYNNGGCREGQMACDPKTGGIFTCSSARYILQACGPGTQCQQTGQNVFCNYATNGGQSSKHEQNSYDNNQDTKYDQNSYDNNQDSKYDQNSFDANQDDDEPYDGY